MPLRTVQDLFSSLFKFYILEKSIMPLLIPYPRLKHEILSKKEGSEKSSILNSEGKKNGEPELRKEINLKECKAVVSSSKKLFHH